jgi:O-antigen/teichoic acid export membrane protein
LKKKQFALNASSGFLTQFTFSAVGFILMPYIISRLGTQCYGIYQLARSALVFFMFLQLGMGPTLVRFFSKAISKKNIEELREINSTAQALLGGVGLLATFLALALIPVFVEFYNIPGELRVDTIGLLICLSLSLFLNMTIIVPQGLVFGCNRYDLVNWIDISTHVFYLLFTIVLFELLYPSILFAGLAILTAQIFRFTALFSLAFRYNGTVALFNPRKVSKKAIRSVLGFSMLNLSNSLGAAVFFQTPVLIIGKVLGEEMVTAFAPVILISNAMQSFLGQITKPLVPMASQDREQNQGDNLGKWSISFGKMAACIGLGVTLPFASFGSDLICFWLGSDLSWIWPSVAIMATAVAISQVQASNYYLALGGGHIKPTVYSQIVMATLSFISILYGATFLNWDVFNIVLFMAVAVFVRNTIYLAYAYSRQFSYVYMNYLLNVYGVPFVITAFCIGIGWGLKLTFPATNLFVLSLEISIVIVIYAIISWFFMLPKQFKNVTIKWVLMKLRVFKSVVSPQ